MLVLFNGFFFLCSFFFHVNLFVAGLRVRSPPVHCDAMATSRKPASGDPSPVRRRCAHAPLTDRRAAPRRGGEERVAWRPRLQRLHPSTGGRRPGPAGPVCDAHATTSRQHRPRRRRMARRERRVGKRNEAQPHPERRRPAARDGSVAVGRIHQPRPRRKFRGQDGGVSAGASARAEPRRQGKGG